MYQSKGKRVYGIFKSVLYGAEYRSLAKRYLAAIENMQTVAQTFSKQQWDVFQEYQKASNDLCAVMVEVALQKPKK